MPFTNYTYIYNVYSILYTILLNDISILNFKILFVVEKLFYLEFQKIMKEHEIFFLTIYGNFNKRTVERPLYSMNVVPVLAD